MEAFVFGVVSVGLLTIASITLWAVETLIDKIMK